MFFVARSFVCIGLVVSALPAPTGTAPRVGDLAQHAAVSTAAALERYCAENAARCLQAARLAAELPRAPDGATPRKLRSIAAPANLRS